MRTLLLALVVAVASIACSPEADEPSGLRPGCGLPTPKASIDATIVPDAFVLEGGTIAKVERERGGFIAAINLPYSVGEAFAAYKEAVRAAGWELLGEDNEGFEAELYLARGEDRLGQVQIRSSRCDDVTLAYVNVVSVDRQGVSP